MYKQLLRLGLAISVVTSVVFLCRAETGLAQTAPDQAPKPPVTTYEYVVRPNDNLSIMVRRSLQLYAQAKNLSLSPAAAMYCETNVVKQLGSRLLDINEAVSVPFAPLEQFIGNSGNLSAEQIAAWNYYAQRARFDLPGLNPINLEAAQAAASPQNSSTQTSPSASEEETSPLDQAQADQTQAAWFWWAIGGSTVVIIYYLLEDRLIKKKR